MIDIVDTIAIDNIQDDLLNRLWKKAMSIEANREWPGDMFVGVNPPNKTKLVKDLSKFFDKKVAEVAFMRIEGNVHMHEDQSYFDHIESEQAAVILLDYRQIIEFTSQDYTPDPQFIGVYNNQPFFIDFSTSVRGNYFFFDPTRHYGIMNNGLMYIVVVAFKRLE